MKEIKVYARAGQGAITTAYLLGQAAVAKGLFVYAFPSFGAARMGAPMNAFIRVDDKPIRLRSQIYEPDYIIVADATLSIGFDVLSGLKDDGIAIINEKKGVEPPKGKGHQKIYVVPGDEIAMQTIGRPIANTALIGALAKATGLVDLKAIEEAIKLRLAGKGLNENIAAAEKGYAFIK